MMTSLCAWMETGNSRAATSAMNSVRRASSPENLVDGDGSQGRRRRLREYALRDAHMIRIAIAFALLAAPTLAAAQTPVPQLSLDHRMWSAVRAAFAIVATGQGTGFPGDALSGHGRTRARVFVRASAQVMELKPGWTAPILKRRFPPRRRICGTMARSTRSCRYASKSFARRIIRDEYYGCWTRFSCCGISNRQACGNFITFPSAPSAARCAWSFPKRTCPSLCSLPIRGTTTTNFKLEPGGPRAGAARFRQAVGADGQPGNRRIFRGNSKAIAR